MMDDDGNDEDHICGSDHTRALRLVLSALQSDEWSYQRCVAEMVGCNGCFDAVVRWLVAMVAGDVAVQSKSVEAATGVVASQLAKEMGWLSPYE